MNNHSLPRTDQTGFTLWRGGLTLSYCNPHPGTAFFSLTLIKVCALARKEQQSTLDSAMASTVRDAVDSVLTQALRELRADIQATNNSVKELRVELEALASATKQTRDRVDSVQAAAREDRRTVTDLRNQLERLTEKMTEY